MLLGGRLLFRSTARQLSISFLPRQLGVLVFERLWKLAATGFSETCSVMVRKVAEFWHYQVDFWIKGLEKTRVAHFWMPFR